MIGEKLSHFEITARLGEGGMGEVWRARDTKLGREVAIKVLPAEFTRDPERLARFEREARVLASLNHPNVAGIHEVGEDGGVHFLVMELVDGEDLQARLARGPLSVEEAVPLALQVATGLEAAHERGIVHRDLKPANVKLTFDGQAKVLDFGLARAGGDAPDSDAELTHSPTLTGQRTQAGVILGTAGYMAPEQARGEEATRRSDVWSFGVLLYEMLAGRRLFEAATVSDTLARVLLAEIDLESLDPRPPRRIEILLRRCLTRDPRKRLQAIGEARVTLEEQLADPGRGDSPPRAGAERAPAGSALARWLPWAVALVAVVAAGVWGRRPAATPAEGGVVRYRLAPLELPFDFGARGVALSPRGDRVALEAPGRLLIRELDELEPRVLVDGLSSDVPAPFWSPDGSQVAYFDAGRLWRVPADGGAPVTVASVPSGYNAGAWGADDRIVFVETRGDAWSVSARGGSPERLITRVEGEDVDFHQPTFLPGGRALLYAVHRAPAVDTLEVFEEGERRVIFRLENQPRSNPQVVNDPVYSPTGHVLFRRDVGDEGVWALPFSWPERRATGEPLLVAGGGAWPSVSADGRRLVYAEHAGTAPRQLLRLTASGTAAATPQGEPLDEMGPPAISPDGRRVAFSAVNGAQSELFVLDVEGRLAQLTRTPENEMFPTWTPDGAALIYAADAGEGTHLYRLPADGSGAAEKLVDAATAPHMAAGGETLVYRTFGREPPAIAALDVASGEETILVTSPNDFSDPAISPDGRVLAYTGWETGPAALLLRLVPSGTTSRVVPGTGQTRFAWSRDGSRLYFFDRSGLELRAVSVGTAPALSVGPAERVVDLRALDLGPIDFSTFDVFPGDAGFAVVEAAVPEAGLGHVVLVENWFEASF